MHSTRLSDPRGQDSLLRVQGEGTKYTQMDQTRNEPENTRLRESMFLRTTQSRPLTLHPLYGMSFIIVNY
jgi:hypothetical protein